MSNERVELATRVMILAMSIIALIAMTSCEGKNEAPGLKPMDHATLLSIEDGDGYAVARIKNPWDTTRLIQTLVLTDDVTRSDLPEGTRIKVPVSHTLVMTTVHSSLMREMGCLDAIAGVCDPEYLTVRELQESVRKGQVADCGSSMSPSIERIMALHPDAILLSPYEKMDLKKLQNTGIPIIQCADYMEKTPLGRAEWIRFYGLLTGRRAVADSIFNATHKRYEELKAVAGKARKKPTVLSDMRYGQIWYVPSATSTIGQMYNDANAANPFTDKDMTAGSIPMSPEQVLIKARHADIWMIKTGQDVTKQTLDNDNPIYKEFDAYRTGNIWTCNTMTTAFFDEVPFHPDYLLADFIRIFHPELNIPGKNRYYTKAKQQ